MRAKMTRTPFAPDSQPTPQMPLAVQILSTILFAAFAISVTIVALVFFLPAGIALAVFLGWRGGFAPQSLGRTGGPAQRAEVTQPVQRPSADNESFAAYKQSTLDRLEKEQESFDAFLTKLRAARERTEFDQFMEDRAGKTASIAAA